MESLAALLTLAAFATSVISAVLGMAGGMVLMGVYALTLPVQVAMILHGVTQAFANGFRAWFLRERIYGTGLVGYAIGAALAFALFTGLALVVAAPVLFLLLGAIPLALQLVPLRFAPQFDKRPAAIACGALVTAASLLVGVSGPLLDVFFVRAELDRFEVIATKATTQTAGHLLKIAYFGGLVGGPPLDLPLWIYPLVIACAYLGTRLGGRMLESWNEAGFRLWTGRIVIALSLVYLLQGASELARGAAW
jgi:uncharacterized membrane protein YfcA